MLVPKTLKTILTERLGIAEDVIAAEEQKAIHTGRSLEENLLHEGVVDEEALYKAAAEKFGVPFVSLKDHEIDKSILNLIPAPLAQTHSVIVFQKDAEGIDLAMLDPEDIQTIEFIHRKTGLTPRIHITTPSDVRESLRRYHADLEQSASVKIAKDGGETASAGDLKKEAEQVSVINIVNSILENAVFEDASDIHIEPTDKEVMVRYRVDGLLKEVMTLPKQIKEGLVARMKILANLKIDEHMVPQDGRFKIDLQDDKFSFRVSIMPVYDGEKIVLRLLKEGQKPLTLDQLGFLAKEKKKVEAALARPHGTILVTGPTGSGKTTTLYSMLGMLNQPDVNICTIEDPIEYHVKGVNQSQINPRVGFTFAGGLRAFLRQDPDIIMVGEIRDEETAEIAIHAAMTGHVVLSTLHTNDAPTAIPRLLDMDVPPFLIAFTMNVIIAQRLVRRACEHCKKPYQLSADEVKELSRYVALKDMLPWMKENGMTLEKAETSLETMTFYRSEGCARCGKSGYKGRVGIYEVLEVDDELAKKINARATADEVKDHARAHGMMTMLEDGIIKAKQGQTTVEEVLSATRE